MELGSPAEHLTIIDHEMELPTAAVVPDRKFGGQTFVRFAGVQDDGSDFGAPPIGSALAECEVGIREATGGLAAVSILKAVAGADDADALQGTLAG